MRTVSLINEVVKQIQSHTDGVVAIYVYGSHVYKNQNASSDIDVLVILMVVDPGQLCALRAIEDEYHSQGYDLGIMVHTAQEIDAGFGLQGEIFIHRNRCWFFIKEMQDHANLVWGKDMFTNIVLPSQSVLKTEAVRVLRSLTYEARKKYIN
jgi:predicted nucleotidyltransferase